ncbi:protein transport protein bos1 [Coemansia sp. RSA 2599]|nr:protein transport protein bos1 [Coemansia sp. RSA 2598]KAJ1829341.1 protein transport protein bos1 [Coemansia sp. RSA 2599]
MTSEYNAAQRLLHKVKQSVSDFELGKYNDELVIKAAIVQDLQTLGKRVTEYRLIGRQEATERKRNMMLDRASSMADDHEQLKRRYEKLKQRKTEQAMYQDTRQELFQRTAAMGGGGAREPMDTAIVMDPQAEEGFWGRSEQALDGFIAQGMASLDSLREQRGLLQGAHRRILNADNTLGLSRSVITYINRRTTQDKIFLVGGMFVTCVFIYFIVHYFG